MVTLGLHPSKFKIINVKLVSVVLTLLFCIVFSHGNTSRVYAGDPGVGPGETLTTNPKSRQENLTASVPDIVPPSVPILVSPVDQSSVVTTTPTFIWNPSTDNVAVASYQLYLDGTLLFDNIPTASTTNSNYTLVVEDGEMKLKPTTGLTQGTHTWFVKVFDTSSNSSISATWTFNVDTVGPIITITNVGEVSTSISSSNSSSIPSQALQLATNSPQIKGKSENGATLQLTLAIPNQPDQIFTQKLSSSTFSFQLGVLPTNTIVYISILGTDPLGNNSSINNVPIYIKENTVVIPPILSTNPSSSPVSIVVPRPSEVVNQVQNQLKETHNKIIQAIPLAQAITNTRSIKNIISILPAISFAAPILIATIALAQSGFSIFAPLLSFLTKVLQAIGIIPSKKPRGLVYDTKTGSAIAFATVTIINDGKLKSIDSVVSDVYGVYHSVKLPIGEYHIEVSHSDYVFPTTVSPKFLHNIYDFYRGEQFNINRTNEEVTFLIPMDPKNYRSAQISKKIYFYTVLSLLRRLIRNMFYPMATISLVITILFPTILNVAILCIYFILIVVNLVKSHREPELSIHVTDKHSKPIENVFIRCLELNTNRLRGLLSSDKHGFCSVHVPVGEYILIITKDGYAVSQQTQDYSTVYVHHRQRSTQEITLIPIDEALLKEQV